VSQGVIQGISEGGPEDKGERKDRKGKMSNGKIAKDSVAMRGWTFVCKLRNGKCRRVLRGKKKLGWERSRGTQRRKRKKQCVTVNNEEKGDQ